MARQARTQLPPGRYHLTIRGVERRPTFVDEEDYEAYIRLLAEAVRRFEWILLDFCLMPNHVHLLIECTQSNLSEGMGWLNGVYAQRFNRRHCRPGHLFQGRFHHTVVDDDLYLVTLAAYIALNPVRARLRDSPAEWPWSGAGLEAADLDPSWLARSRLKREVNAITGRADFLGPVVG